MKCAGVIHAISRSRAGCDASGAWKPLVGAVLLGPPLIGLVRRVGAVAPGADAGASGRLRPLAAPRRVDLGCSNIH
jgi:hypothetical protein